MIWTAPQIDRSDFALRSPERQALQDWLRFHRQTLLMKCAGLTAEQLKTASTPPSNLTLLGLVRHMSDVERMWFRIRFAGQPLDTLYCPADTPDGDLDDITDADAEQDFATFTAEWAAVDECLAGRGLDETFLDRRNATLVDLRWVFLHLIEEYARHNGHADLIRERIDGVTGD